MNRLSKYRLETTEVPQCPKTEELLQQNKARVKVSSESL